MTNETQRPFAVSRMCPECPWQLSAPIGKFAPDRYRNLAKSARAGTNPFDPAESSLFACHMTPFDGERTCAGFLAVCGLDSNGVRIALALGRLDPGMLTPRPGLYPSYRAMAVANGVPADDPALVGLRDDAATTQENDRGE